LKLKKAGGKTAYIPADKILRIEDKGGGECRIFIEGGQDFVVVHEAEQIARDIAGTISWAQTRALDASIRVNEQAKTGKQIVLPTNNGR